MRLTRLSLALCLAVSPAFAQDASTAVSPPVEDAGTLADAPYRIDIPADWNGELVVLAHGFEPVGVPRASPWPADPATPMFTSARYAVAQSGYATQGWAVRDAIANSERLRAHFVQRHGLPKRTWFVGMSMGGGIAIATIEQQAAHYDGALSLCGANLPGDVLANELFTSLVAFDALFPPGEGKAASRLSDPASSPLGQGEVMDIVSAALPRDAAATKSLAARLEVPAEALPGIIGLHYLVFRDMLARAGGMPVDNRTTRYTGFGDDVAFNAAVPRYAGDAKAMAYATSAPALTGRLQKPLVLLDNADDPTIAPRFRPVYAQRAQGAAVPPLILPAAPGGHCNFSGDQVRDAFRVLTGWVETGKRPGG
jgi:pimeloyl-ACP methyl ester carboxylesterase